MAELNHTMVNLDEKSIETLDVLCSELDTNRGEMLRDLLWISILVVAVCGVFYVGCLFGAYVVKAAYYFSY